MIPQGLYYSKEHEWLKVDGEIGTIGITDHAQEKLGDIVFVELPEVGRTVAVQESISTIESVKAVSDVFTPVSGEIVEVHEELKDEPEIVNQDPYGKGWIVKVALSKPAELKHLMNAAAYAQFVAEESEE